MRQQLWCLRLILLLVVSLLVFSPLAVRGASIASQPVGWNHDTSALFLPSSPAYPAVVVYRDVRMRMTERSFEKSQLMLGFANEDAAAIANMAQRQDFVRSASHASTYQQTFDRCVGWLVVADQRGNDVSYLLARIKNDHLAQQVALNQALSLMPEWSQESIKAARNHAAEVLTEAIRLLEGVEAVQSYLATTSSMFPELALPQLTSDTPAPAVVVVAPPSQPPLGTAAEQDESPISEADTADAPRITSLRLSSKSIEFGASVKVTCNLATEDDDLSFSWWCSRGDLVATRTRATWTAPQRAGVYEINVTVTDDLGRSDTRSVEVRVLDQADEQETEDEGSDGVPENPAPGETDAQAEITGLSVSATHKYLEQSLGGGYSILVSRECTIQCLVAEADGLDFDWTVTGGGAISGSGDTVTFKAPSMPGYSKVSVTVTDQEGGQDSATITLYVSTCTYCF
jgi:hypothetical protein